MTSVLLVLLSVSAVGALIILPSIFKYGIKQIFNVSAMNEDILFLPNKPDWVDCALSALFR